MVGFYFSPGDPSIFDTIRFYDQSFDPAGLGIVSQSWSFGDGATASGCCPTHRYEVDGTYTLTLTVTTTDGRTASTSRDVIVRTHDVAVTTVLVPRSARAGDTHTITVTLTNRGYPERVRVQLLKSVAGGGWRPVGSLTRAVPVHGGGRATDFEFDHTFGPDDAQLGKVSFRGIAIVEGARDAVPRDNSFVSPPTEVRD